MSAYPLSTVLHREWAADLTPARLYALLRLRVDVFVVEQECPYPELDGRDLEHNTRHFWISSDTDPEVPAACLRLLTEPDGGYRIGRVCTARDARGRGLSRRLMEAVLADVGDAESVLDAQVQVAGLYSGFGYEPVGEPFVEDGIPHVTMRRPAPSG
ncbi:MAG TPA: GNAT family N-acetyltransferase [Pseudonocardiaceae bacterium]|nr:GNAT family N-acetyltransferase [Pseudonocardiaceae bacterium]